MSDPIQVASLDNVVNEVADDDWKENMQDYLYNNENKNVFLEIAGDDLHEDNVSGGSAYSLELTKLPSIDSNFLNEPNETTFINYLRIGFVYCGFPGVAKPGTKNDYKAFFNKVKPQLKPI